MEINLKKLGEQAIESTTGSKNMRLSENATSMVFQLFTKNVYSNPIGTVVREITSNCFDSHIEAKINAPVVIRKSVDKQTNTINISFIDYGVGMSPDRIENIYGVYFESTKRCDNTQIGGFGIGGKTPLAYKRSTGAGEGEYDNSFYVITVFDKQKYYYCIYEGKESPVISLLHSEPTEEHNGTEVRIPVLPKDLNTFKKEMVRQLYYFENVIFEGFTEDEESPTQVEELLTNEYQIVRGKSFLFRGREYSSNVHVCLGRVAYPLDFSILGLSSSDFNFPVAIRLEVGEIGVTVSRETLDYSESTIKILKKKLNEVKAELTVMLAKQYENIVTLEDYFKVKNDFGYLFFPNGEKINIGEIIKQKDVDFSNFKYSFTKMPTDKHLFRLFFEAKLYGKKEGRSRRRRWSSNNDEDTSYFEGGYDILLDKKKALYFFDGEFERKIIKQAWLKSQHVRYYLISKKNIVDKSLASAISDLFNVHDDIIDANGQPTAYMNSLVEMQEEYMQIIREHCTDYMGIEVPEAFVESRKREKISQEMRNTTIPVKFIGSYSNYRVKLDALFNLNYVIYYGTKTDEDKILGAKRMFERVFDSELIVTHYDEYQNKFSGQKKGIMFIRIAENNVRYMDFCKNAKHIDTFQQTMLRRKTDAVVEYFQSANFIEKYQKLDELYRHNAFKNISPEWGKKIETINKFVCKLNKGTQKDWMRYKWEFAKYFPITDIKNTKEQEAFIATIDELFEMQEVNADTMQHINTPYNLGTANDTYWNLLKKVMVY
jgi:hypothetical protein